MKRIPSCVVLASFLAAGLALPTAVAAVPVRDVAGPQLTPAGEDLGSFEQWLESVVPARMGTGGTVAASVAIARDGKLIYGRGFGQRNAYYSSPVRPDTLFDAASNGKPVTAAIALQLVAEGKLALDRPLSAYLHRQYLDGSAWSQAITARQVLSHTSGLPNRIWAHVTRPDRKPGSAFGYSGNGYLYLQKVIEQQEGAPLEIVARKRVFGPLGMISSSFVAEPRFAGRMAAGHVPLAVPVSYYLMFVVGALLVVAAAAAGWWAVRRRNPATAASVALASALCLSAALLPFYYYFSIPALAFFGGIAAATAICALLFACVVEILAPLFPGRWNGAGSLLVGLAGAIVFARTASIGIVTPIPFAGPSEARASSSLRSTPQDLTRLIGAYLKPGFIPAGILQDATSSQAKVRPGTAWGLGLGIQNPGPDQTLWQWGENPGSQSLSIGQPSSQTAIVFMSTGNNGLAIGREIAARFYGVKEGWSIR